MSEHTPGPWTVVAEDTVYAFPPSTDPEAIAAGYANDAQLIAEVSVVEDARLIAAAPDLLAALEFLCFTPIDPNVTQRERVERGRAAIAKATGQSESAPTSRT